MKKKLECRLCGNETEKTTPIAHSPAPICEYCVENIIDFNSIAQDTAIKYWKIEEMDLYKALGNIGYIEGRLKSPEKMLNLMADFDSLDELRKELHKELRAVLAVMRKATLIEESK